MATIPRCSRIPLPRGIRWRPFGSRPRSNVSSQQCDLALSSGEVRNLPSSRMRTIRVLGDSRQGFSHSGLQHCRDSMVVRQIYSTAASLVAPDFQVERVGDAALLHVLQCEIEDLTKQSRNITVRNPPRAFTIVRDEPGQLEMTLKRMYGLEDIELSCALQLVPEKYQRKAEVGEDPQSRTKMLQLTISITKGSAFPALKIKCECYRDCFAIHQVDLENEDSDLTDYRPYFSQSKSSLVNNFQIFLYNRGLNADLALYMERHLENKRLLKSASAIESLHNFLS